MNWQTRDKVRDEVLQVFAKHDLSFEDITSVLHNFEDYCASNSYPRLSGDVLVDQKALMGIMKAGLQLLEDIYKSAPLKKKPNPKKGKKKHETIRNKS